MTNGARAPKIAPKSHLTGPVKPAKTTDESPCPIVQPTGSQNSMSQNQGWNQ